MAKTPFADKPLGQQQGEDVVHGQDEQVEEEEEGCGEEDEIILDDGSGYALPHPSHVSHQPTSLTRCALLLRLAFSAARSMRVPSKAWSRCSRTS